MCLKERGHDILHNLRDVLTDITQYQSFVFFSQIKIGNKVGRHIESPFENER